MRRKVGGFLFGAASAICLALGVDLARELAAEGLRPFSLLLAGAALICLGFGASLAYEAIAYGTGITPTISEITADAVDGHQLAAGALVALELLVTGLLLRHFTVYSARPVAYLLAGGASLVAGVVLATVLHWMP